MIVKELEDTLEIREAVTNAPGFQDSDNGKGSLARSQCISQSSSLFSLYLFVNPSLDLQWICPIIGLRCVARWLGAP